MILNRRGCSPSQLSCVESESEWSNCFSINSLVVQNLTGASKTQRSGRHYVKHSLRQATHYLTEHIVSIVTNQRTAFMIERWSIFSKVILFFFSAALCVHTHETRILPHNKDNHIKGEWIETLLIDLSNLSRYMYYIHQWMFFPLLHSTMQPFSYVFSNDLNETDPYSSFQKVTVSGPTRWWGVESKLNSTNWRHSSCGVRDDSRVEQTTMLWQNSLPVTGETHEKTDIHLFFTITNCQVVRSRSLTNRINYKFMCLSTYWQFI